MNLFNLISAHQGLLAITSSPEGVVTFNNPSGKGATVTLGTIGFASNDPWTFEAYVDLDTLYGYANIFNYNMPDDFYGVQFGNSTTNLRFQFGNVGVDPVGYDRFKLVVTSDGTSVKTIYVDGVQYLTDNSYLGAEGIWGLGTPSTQGSDNYAFFGDMDNIAIYNYAKDATQVASEAMSTPSLSDTGIIRYYTGYNDGVNLFEYVEGDHGVMNNFL